MEFITGLTPKVSDAVDFGLICTVHRSARNKSLGERGMAAVIIVRDIEIEGYKVYIPSDNVVVTTQHV